jgi:excisionase family DNA binding protein
LSNLITVAEVKGLLAVSAPTVYRLAAKGEIPSIRIGGSIRFRIDDIERLLQAGRRAS